jgi:hypothetical protein
MILTTHDVLAKQDLFRPDSEIKNIGIASFLFLECQLMEAVDVDCRWVRKVARLCDNTGVDLGKCANKSQ